MHAVHACRGSAETAWEATACHIYIYMYMFTCAMHMQAQYFGPQGHIYIVTFLILLTR